MQAKAHILIDGVERTIEGNLMPKFEIGQAVEKVSGYKFIGFVIGVVTTRSGKIRYVVENDDGIIKTFPGRKLRSIV